MTKNKKPDFDAFRAWLEKEKYQETTIRGQVRDLGTMWQTFEDGNYPGDLIEGVVLARIQAYQYTHRLFTEYAARTGKAKLPFDEPPAPAVPRALRRKKQVRQKEQVSISGNEWKTLAHRIWTDDSAAGRVLQVMMSTGLRVGDVLRIEPQQLKDAFDRDDGLLRIVVKGGKDVFTTVRGPAEKEWKKLLSRLESSQAANVSWLVAPKGDGQWYAACGAYQSIRRAFAGHCEATKVTPPHNLHRIRRTVAVAVRKAVGLDAAQRVLGHESSNTTAMYTDEVQIDVITKGLEALRDSFENPDFRGVEEVPDKKRRPEGYFKPVA